MLITSATVMDAQRFRSSQNVTLCFSFSQAELVGFLREADALSQTLPSRSMWAWCAQKSRSCAAVSKRPISAPADWRVVSLHQM